jgi:SEFIR domain
MTSESHAQSGEVFISYSWDNEEHVRAVLDLSNRLRAEGVDCVLDQYEESPPEGWPRWMDRKIRDAKFVLMVCTETYYRRVMGDTAAEEGHGVKWEGGLIYQYIYNAGATNTKFIPVVLQKQDKTFIPTPLQSATHYDVSTGSGYDRLYSRLVGRPHTEKPKLGLLRSLPKKDVKTNFSVFLSTPIDPELWDEAKWRGIFVRIYESRPPDLGLAFLNETAARRIFEQWHQRYGDRDAFEELRISIIEGEVRGEQPGYSVHVGVDLENTIKRYREAGLTVNADRDGFLTLTRIHRMNPAPGSRNLESFKQAYRHFKAYTLIPGILKPDQSDVIPFHDLGIYKSTIHFRRVDEIGPNDEDSVVLGSGSVKRPPTEYGKKQRGKKKRKG